MATMGQRISATCRDCGEAFFADLGGGFRFDQFRCELCGRTKNVLHAKYPPNIDGRSMTTEEFHAATEACAGQCSCGGRFLVNAPLRCPKCKSTAVDQGATILDYD
jgi:hypothetical protein